MAECYQMAEEEVEAREEAQFRQKIREELESEMYE